MKKTALENAQEILERFQKEPRGEGPSQAGEIAIGWAIVAVATQIGRVATQLEALDKKFSKHKQK